MASSVFDLAIVVLIAAGLGIIAKLLKQPTILAYLATGVLIGAFGSLGLEDSETFRTFSELGIMLLLFLVGMEINYSSLRLVGKASVFVGCAQIALTFGAAYGFAGLFGFDPLAASYIGIAFALSSTIIVVKLLSDKKDLNSLYGKISVGVLLVQDFAAILILVILGGASAGESIGWESIALALAEGIALFAFMLFLGRKFLPLIFDRVARSSELLFLISLAWVFLVAMAVSAIGFSIEIAGFLAGLALANSSEHHQIAFRIKPLRDFFLIAFFVALGANIAFSNFNGVLVPILLGSLFVLLLKPLFVMVAMGLMGYRKRTGFMAGISMAQISEFSLVLAALGLKLGHIDDHAVALITGAGVITITLSTYLMQWGDSLYDFAGRGLSFFERKKSIEHGARLEEGGRPVVLIGFHRLGESIALGIPRERLLVVEFDPEISKKLSHAGYHHVFGDIADPDVFEAAHIKDAELVISTSPDFDDNAALLGETRRLGGVHGKKPHVVVRAETEREAELLYDGGADYVIFPHLTSGQYFGKTIALDPEMRLLEQLKEKDLELLRTMRTRTAHRTG